MIEKMSSSGMWFKNSGLMICIPLKASSCVFSSLRVIISWLVCRFLQPQSCFA